MIATANHTNEKDVGGGRRATVATGMSNNAAISVTATATITSNHQRKNTRNGFRLLFRKNRGLFALGLCALFALIAVRSYGRQTSLYMLLPTSTSSISTMSSTTVRSNTSNSKNNGTSSSSSSLQLLSSASTDHNDEQLSSSRILPESFSRNKNDTVMNTVHHNHQHQTIIGNKELNLSNDHPNSAGGFNHSTIPAIEKQQQGIPQLQQIHHHSNKTISSNKKHFNVSTNATTSTNTTTTTNQSSCLQINSLQWKTGPRHGNRHEPLLTHQMVQRMIIDLPGVLGRYDDGYNSNPLHKNDIKNDTYHVNGNLLQSILGQTLCFPNSRFVNVSTTIYPKTIKSKSMDRMLDDVTVNALNIRLWSVRLIYLAIQFHQHQHAIPEAKIRYATMTKGQMSSSSSSNVSTPITWTCDSELKQYGIGNYDYECPSAKYLVFALGGNGLGANIRGGLIVGLLAGLSLHRVVLVINNGQMNGHGGTIRIPWQLASCPRRDYQCFFRPLTPCTVSKFDLENNMYILNRNENTVFLRNGILPDHVNTTKIIQYNINFLPKIETTVEVRMVLSQYANQFIQTIPVHDPRRPILVAAKQSLLEQDMDRPGYNFAAANLRVHHALALYGMRPHIAFGQQINAIMDEIIPLDFNPEITIGLPIRGSDKCISESECLSFEQHIQVSSHMWTQHLKKESLEVVQKGQHHHHHNSSTLLKKPTIVFTTESKSVVMEQAHFANNTKLQSQFPYQFQFVTNTRDVTPDTGFLRDSKVSADDVMLSSMSSFKTQLLSRVTIGNCCSNYHVLLSDFLMEGCGAASTNTFLCLQEYPDPALMVCCGWHKACKRQKQIHLQNISYWMNQSKL